MNIVIEYDSSAANAPAGFKQAVEAAVQFYDYLIKDAITVPIVFSYGEIQGQKISSNAVAESSTNGNVETFSSLVKLLTAAATSATDATSVANLPTVDPTSGGSFWVSDAQARVFGLSSEPGYTDPEDGFVGISSALKLTWDPYNRSVAGTYDAIGALEHEIAEVLGRYSYLAGGPTFNGKSLYSPLDLFRFTGGGVRTVAYSSGYFSIDGGKTLQLQFNDPNNGGDAGDWASGIVGDSFGSAYSGTAGLISPTDLQVMDVLGYQVAPLGNPIAGAAPTLSAINGAAASITDAALFGLITNDYIGALSVTTASLDAASTGAGTLTVDQVNHKVVFTPAAGFVGPATGTATISDGYGGSVNQALAYNVVVQASAPVVAAANTTSTSVSGNVTVIQTFSPTGALITTEVITTYPNSTVTTWSDAAGAAYASTIQTVYPGGVTELQNFDGAWHQLNATITFQFGNGGSEVQSFDGSFNMTGATVTNVYGASSVVQNFNANWVQLSATVTQAFGNITETQNFGASWVQTSSNLTTTFADGSVESQNFDANWIQTSATTTTHPNAGESIIQYFDAGWNHTSTTFVWVNGNQTTTQYDDANWNMLNATVDTVFTAGALADQLVTYGPAWTRLGEVDTATNGGKSYFTYGTTGGGQNVTAASGHSTTFIFTPGQIAGDAIAGLHTNNLGGAIHDVIDFKGYGAGAHLVQVDATHWQVVSTNNPTEAFTLTGGATLAAGDYAFVAANATLNSSSVGGGAGGVVTSTAGAISTSEPTTSGIIIQSVDSDATAPTSGGAIVNPVGPPSVALFNQFAASGFGGLPDGGGAHLILAPQPIPESLLAAPLASQ